MSINQSQGMTLDKVLFDARYAPFQHSHAYVLFSRVRNQQSIACHIDDSSSSCATTQASAPGSAHGCASESDGDDEGARKMR